MKHWMLRVLAAPIVALGLGCGGIADLGGSADGGRTADANHGEVRSVDANDRAVVDAAMRDARVPSHDASDDVVTREATVDTGADVAASDASHEAGSGDAAATDAARDAAADASGADAALPASCSDDVKDGAETDVDCGGPVCHPCGVSQMCLVNTDCGNAPGCVPVHGCACDAVTDTCVYNHCTDEKKDDGETDVDCGGGFCTGCGPAKKCLVDRDCGNGTVSGCDPFGGGCFCEQSTDTCVYSHCFDQVIDEGETDVDCGGGQCPPCEQGKGCQVDTDCTTDACDAISLACVGSQCNDDQEDGLETDVDCGGSDTCSRCRTGKMCNVHSDCLVGNVCNEQRCVLAGDGGA